MKKTEGKHAIGLLIAAVAKCPQAQGERTHVAVWANDSRSFWLDFKPSTAKTATAATPNLEAPWIGQVGCQKRNGMDALEKACFMFWSEISVYFPPQRFKRVFSANPFRIISIFLQNSGRYSQLCENIIYCIRKCHRLKTFWVLSFWTRNQCKWLPRLYFKTAYVLQAKSGNNIALQRVFDTEEENGNCIFQIQHSNNWHIHN